MNAQKVADMSLDEFVQAVLGHDQKVAERVQELGIDVKGVLEKAKPGIDKYGITTGKTVGVARINEAILVATSDAVTGYVVSIRDRYGSGAPARLPLLRAKGDHLELVNWSGLVTKFGDEKIEMKFPARVTARVVQDREYKGIPQFRLVSLDEYEPIDAVDLARKLSKVALSAGQISTIHENTVQVIKGKIAYINPATMWKGKEKAGSYPLLCDNSNDSPQSHPVLQISLRTENDQQVRAVFDRQKSAVPTIIVEDMLELIQDAVAGSPSADDQARFLGETMRDRDVLVVGYITKLNAVNNTVYIEVGASALFDAPFVGQAAFPSAAAPAPRPTPTPAPAATTPAAGPAKVSRKDEIKAKVIELAGVLDRNVADFAPGEIKANWKQYADVADAVIEQALKEAQAECAAAPAV